MGCEQVREALSARLDGEDSPHEMTGVDRHVEGCGACRQWYDDAALVTRLTRTAVATDAPVATGASERDLMIEAVLAVAPGPGWARTGRALRIALSVLGFGQFALGIAQVAALGMAHGQAPAGGMTSDHLWHESAAWNVAVGAAYMWIAVRRGRPAGVLPIMTAFVAVLVLLSIDDLLTGEVAVSALLTHGFIALGYAILLLLRHPGFDAVTPPAKRSWRLRFDDEAEFEGADERVVAMPMRGATAQVVRPAAESHAA
jgi:predicted anti-sigma-YlaC factor YlaD